MITTVDTKRQVKTVFTIGSNQPEETVLIIGSCRTVAYLNYLDRWNRANGEPWRIHFIDPFNYNFDDEDRLRQLEPAITALETDARVLEVIRSTTIYIHEHFQYFGMFNSSPENPKNIFQFGMNPRLNIAVPNFHDRFVLFSEQVDFDQETRKMIEATHRVPSQAAIERMRTTGLDSLEKFYALCRLSSFPEMEQHMRDNWRRQRFFWTANHVSRHFTTFIFGLMANKLGIQLTHQFWEGAVGEDLFSNTPSRVTQYDIDAYGLEWGGAPEPLFK